MIIRQISLASFLCVSSFAFSCEQNTVNMQLLQCKYTEAKEIHDHLRPLFIHARDALRSTKEWEPYDQAFQIYQQTGGSFGTWVLVTYTENDLKQTDAGKTFLSTDELYARHLFTRNGLDGIIKSTENNMSPYSSRRKTMRNDLFLALYGQQEWPPAHRRDVRNKVYEKLLALIDEACGEEAVLADKREDLAIRAIIEKNRLSR